MNDSHVVYGPQNNTNFDDVSLAELFYVSLKTKDPFEIIMVDHSTGEEVTREECLQSTLKLAKILHNLGITENDILGVISTNTWKFLSTVISSFYIGATITAVNPNSSADDLLHYLRITKPKVIFVSRNVLDKIRVIKNELSCLKYVIIYDGDIQQAGEILFDDLLREEIDFNLFTMHNGEKEESLILYSSGTTGLPKGVVFTSENMKTYLDYCCDPDVIAVDENCILLGILPLFHALGILTQLACIFNGKRNILLEAFKPEVFLNSIQEYKITKLIIVPPIILFLAKSPLVDQYDMTSVKDIISGAAPLGKEIEDDVSKRLNIKIRQIYGLTETAGISCTPQNVYKPGSAGKVIKGHQIKIIDPESQKILPENQNGEIYFKGPGVMRGYKNNEAETRKIIDHEGYLHTGDVGYVDEGYLYIVDRLKELIKYKGFQVAPAQLEDLLLKHPAVKDVGVIGRVDERVGELPTAFIVKLPDVEVTEQEIVAYIAGKVSIEKQLHGGVIFIKEIPKSPSGKILRKELKRML